MVEDHRRVESRQIIGSGMATDPARIQKVADEAARHARAWRAPPEAGFGDVLGRAPARGELADEPPPPPVPEVPDATDATDAANGVPSEPGPTAASAPPRMLRTTPRAPDPRQKALMRQLEQALPSTAAAGKATTRAEAGTAGQKKPTP